MVPKHTLIRIFVETYRPYHQLSRIIRFKGWSACVLKLFSKLTQCLAKLVHFCGGFLVWCRGNYYRRYTHNLAPTHLSYGATSTLIIIGRFVEAFRPP